MRVAIQISDPWELGEALGWRPLTGELVRTDDAARGGRALVRLDTPIDHAGDSFGHVVVTPRFAGEALALRRGCAAACNVMGVPEAMAAEAAGADHASWRGGGLALIGTLEVD